MKLLKIGISGVRGIVGDSMTPKLAMDFASAFGTFVHGGTVLIGRDTRVSGPMLEAACRSALAAAGCDIRALGVCPTPVLQWAVKRERARGGISITAGHNDIQWNALTFINREGTYLNPFQGAEVLDLFHLGQFRKASVDGLGKIADGAGDAEEYFLALARFLDVRAIAAAKLKVVIDACNGAGAPFLDRLAGTLGFELVPVNDRPSGFFPHDPEPRPRNAQQVVSVLNVVGADAGFLLNSDVSRVSLVSETGESLSEEFTFPLVADAWLESRCGPVVTNLATSRMIEDVARSRNCPIVRTKVGQSFAIHAAFQEDAVLAGEGSGGVAIPAFHPAFDGFLTIGIILETIARRGKPLSALVGALPRYHNVKEKLSCPPAKVHSVVSEVKRFFHHHHEIDTSDGIRVDDENGWVQVRASTTEPMIRVVAEDRSAERARRRADEIIDFINGLIQ
jgi:phosphoglucosamine mutase